MTRLDRSLWGLTPEQLHDRYWASRGVQVVRQGEPFELPPTTELFLLTDPRVLVHFPLRELLEALYWSNPRLVCVRLHDARDLGYRERAIADEERRFVRFERSYRGADNRPARVGLTRDPELARLWHCSPDPRQGWERLRRAAPPRRRRPVLSEGRVYDRASDRQVGEFVRHLAQVWRRPDLAVPRVTRAGTEAWADADARIGAEAHFVGPVWVGAGRRIDPGADLIGPGVLWDDPDARPPVTEVQWEQVEPDASAEFRSRRRSSFALAGKRAFDIAFSLLLLTATLPLYGLIIAAIWLEDGRPFFFLHRRETLGGKEFPCIKFRSMRKDAERLKTELAALNRADGPQFYIERDPRHTRVGRFLRRYNLDELPQFVNVLLGHMSVVGPRPSPRRENQFCPAWRESRLSVRPGITGLWQVKRTREPGRDFQEWIKYDIEYVERASWRLDLSILLKTFGVLLKLGD